MCFWKVHGGPEQDVCRGGQGGAEKERKRELNFGAFCLDVRP